MEVEKILAQMTVEEKAALVSGTDFMYTNPIPRLGVPSLCTSDGPHGLRKQTGSGDNGVSESEPATVMCAYDQINGVYCSENKWLLTDVLRDEWGFDGAVMSDWGAVRDRVLGLKAGLDIEMPGDTDICRRAILDAVAGGNLQTEVRLSSLSSLTFAQR